MEGVRKGAALFIRQVKGYIKCFYLLRVLMTVNDEFSGAAASIG